MEADAPWGLTPGCFFSSLEIFFFFGEFVSVPFDFSQLERQVVTPGVLSAGLRGGRQPRENAPTRDTKLSKASSRLGDPTTHRISWEASGTGRHVVPTRGQPQAPVV